MKSNKPILSAVVQLASKQSTKMLFKHTRMLFKLIKTPFKLIRISWTPKRLPSTSK